MGNRCHRTKVRFLSEDLFKRHSDLYDGSTRAFVLGDSNIITISSRSNSSFRAHLKVVPCFIVIDDLNILRMHFVNK